MSERIVWNRSIGEIAEMLGCTAVTIQDTNDCQDNGVPNADSKTAFTEKSDDFQRLHDALFDKYRLYDIEVQIKRITELLEQGVNINARNWQGETILYSAIDRYLGEECLQCDYRGYCMDCGRWQSDMRGVELITFLLEMGANPNICNRGGISPLHLLAEKGRVDIMAVLLDNGADIEAKDGHGCTPLFYTFEYYPQATKFLIERGADIEARNSNGETPLFYAVSRRIRLDLEWNEDDEDEADDDEFEDTDDSDLETKPCAVRFLIEHGANVNVRNNAGKTPLDLAVEEGDAELIEMLRKRSDDVNLTNFTKGAIT